MTGVMYRRPKRTHTLIAIIFIVTRGENEIEKNTQNFSTQISHAPNT